MVEESGRAKVSWTSSPWSHAGRQARSKTNLELTIETSVSSYVSSLKEERRMPSQPLEGGNESTEGREDEKSSRARRREGRDPDDERKDLRDEG